jgi:LysM repeat protein
MNQNESPLVPQGSFLEQKNKGRARVRIAIFVVLAVHGVGLMALLLGGCKPNGSQTGLQDGQSDTNTVADQSTNSMHPITETNPSVTQQISNPPSVIPDNVPPVTSPPATTQVATEYKIVKGDTFAKIAKQYHVPVQALVDANPGVEPSKLKIDQKIKIPAVASNSISSPTTAGVTGTGGGQTYSVKSGDTLTKIATQFGTSVKAIRSLNHLKTDAIKVGQKLEIPSKSSDPTLTADTNGSSAAGATH